MDKNLHLSSETRSSAVQTMNTLEQGKNPAITSQEFSAEEDWVILTVIRERNECKWYLTREQPAEQKVWLYLETAKPMEKWTNTLKQAFHS